MTGIIITLGLGVPLLFARTSLRPAVRPFAVASILCAWFLLVDAVTTPARHSSAPVVAAN